MKIKWLRRNKEYKRDKIRNMNSYRNVKIVVVMGIISATLIIMVSSIKKNIRDL